MTHNTPDPAAAAAAAVWGTEAQAVSDAQAMAARHARLDREEMEARSERISLAAQAAQAAQEAEAKANADRLHAGWLASRDDRLNPSGRLLNQIAVNLNAAGLACGVEPTPEGDAVVAGGAGETFLTCHLDDDGDLTVELIDLDAHGDSAVGLYRGTNAQAAHGAMLAGAAMLRYRERGEVASAEEAAAKAADEAAEAAYQAAQARYNAAVAYRRVAAKACDLGHATAAFMHAAHDECIAADNALQALAATRPAAARKARA